MALNRFLGKSASWLRQKVDRVQDQIANANMVIGANAGDTSMSKQKVAELETVLEQLYAALRAIPEEAANFPVEQTVRITQTRVVFR